MIHVLRELHVPGFDLKDLQPSLHVRHSHVQLAIESAWPPQRGFDDGDAIGGTQNDDLGGWFDAIHEGEKLTDDALLHLSSCFFSLWGNGIKLVYENNGPVVIVCVGLGILEGPPEIGLALSCALADHFRAVDDEEVSARFRSHRPGQGGFAAPAGSSY